MTLTACPMCGRRPNKHLREELFRERYIGGRRAVDLGRAHAHEGLTVLVLKPLGGYCRLCVHLEAEQRKFREFAARYHALIPTTSMQLDEQRLATAIETEVHVDTEHGFPAGIGAGDVARAIAAESARLVVEDPA